MAHILLVDDEPELREIYKRLLEDEGHFVETADGGPAALRRLAGQAPDVLLVDVEMPVMTGVELIRQIRARSEFDELPIVMLTSHQLPEQVQDGLDAGSNGYIIKPLVPQELVEELRLLLTSGELI